MQKLTAYGLTDVGRQRDHNEDTFAVESQLDLFVVCDGMGGHASGEVASALTVDHLVDFIETNKATQADALPYSANGTDDPAAMMLSNAVQFANDRVYIEGMKDSKLEGMGTTVVAIRALQDRMVLCHVGDSRIYRWRHGGRLEQVTRDHSLLNYKIDRGELNTEEEIANFKQGNVIVRAIGLKDYVEPEMKTLPRRAGDVFLLCSDGLTDLVDDWSIENVLEANFDDLEEASQCLIRMANDRGGKDNITVVIVRVDDDPAETPMEAEATDPRGVQAVVEEVEATDPVGIAAVDDADFDDFDDEPEPLDDLGYYREYDAEDDGEHTRPDGRPIPTTDPRLRSPLAGAAPPPEPEPEPAAPTAAAWYEDPSVDIREIETDPNLPTVPPATELDYDYVDSDEPVQFGTRRDRHRPGRVAARRSAPSPNGQLPSAKPAAKASKREPKITKPTQRAARPGQSTRPLPAVEPQRPKAKRPARAPKAEPEDGDGLPSIIIDDTLLE